MSFPSILELSKWISHMTSTIIASLGLVGVRQSNKAQVVLVNNIHDDAEYWKQTVS